MTTDFSVTSFDPDNSDRFVRLAKDLGVSSFGLNLMVLQPGQRGRIHLHHRQEEVYLVTSGELSLLIEGEVSILRPGDAARVGPAVRRQLANAGAEPCVLFALGGDGVHEGRDAEAFVDWDDVEGGTPQEIPLPGDIPHS